MIVIFKLLKNLESRYLQHAADSPNLNDKRKLKRFYVLLILRQNHWTRRLYNMNPLVCWTRPYLRMQPNRLKLLPKMFEGHRLWPIMLPPFSNFTCKGSNYTVMTRLNSGNFGIFDPDESNSNVNS